MECFFSIIGALLPLVLTSCGTVSIHWTGSKLLHSFLDSALSWHCVPSCDSSAVFHPVAHISVQFIFSYFMFNSHKINCRQNRQEKMDKINPFNYVCVMSQPSNHFFQPLVTYCVSRLFCDWLIDSDWCYLCEPPSDSWCDVFYKQQSTTLSRRSRSWTRMVWIHRAVR